MKWLVCGGRDYGNDGPNGPEFSYIIGKLYKLASERSIHYVPDDNWLPSDVEIISGMAKGADTVAVDWAIVNWCTWHEFPAEWDKYGKSAGYKRNIQMLQEGKPDLVIAFPGGKGTAMMVELASKADVEVIVFDGAT